MFILSIMVYDSIVWFIKWWYNFGFIVYMFNYRMLLFMYFTHSFIVVAYDAIVSVIVSMWMSSTRLSVLPLPVALSTAVAAINHQRFKHETLNPRAAAPRAEWHRATRVSCSCCCWGSVWAEPGPGESWTKTGTREATRRVRGEVKTVTVSTLPVLRENEFSFTGAGSGSLAGGESRLLLFVRTDLPGRISFLDDLDNTALPYFTLGEIDRPSVTSRAEQRDGR